MYTKYPPPKQPALSGHPPIFDSEFAGEFGRIFCGSATKNRAIRSNSTGFPCGKPRGIPLLSLARMKIRIHADFHLAEFSLRENSWGVFPAAIPGGPAVPANGVLPFFILRSFRSAKTPGGYSSRRPWRPGCAG
jgi:hypothetical protein